jgi:CheY-like chemotaxis protein
LTQDYAATVLIVDDSPNNLGVLHELLRPLYRVLATTSGESCLRIAAGEPRPDLILLDVMMPGMDGYTVLARLRARRSHARHPGDLSHLAGQRATTKAAVWRWGLPTTSPNRLARRASAPA